MHERPPSFEGPDGRAYSADVFVDDAPGDDGRFGAAIIFVQWSATGDHAVGHLETPYLAFSAAPEEATALIRRLTLHDVKRYLDEAIASAKEPLR
jgi:predicted NodU family carbamoyl transferase